MPARLSAPPLRDSWLIASWLDEPRGGAEAPRCLSRLEHMSYRFPENCIFLDSCRRDSQTAAASSGQPAIAALAQSWNASHDLKTRGRSQMQLGTRENKRKPSWKPIKEMSKEGYGKSKRQQRFHIVVSNSCQLG